MFRQKTGHGPWSWNAIALEPEAEYENIGGKFRKVSSKTQRSPPAGSTAAATVVAQPQVMQATIVNPMQVGRDARPPAPPAPEEPAVRAGDPQFDELCQNAEAINRARNFLPYVVYSALVFCSCGNMSTFLIYFAENMVFPSWRFLLVKTSGSTSTANSK